MVKSLERAFAEAASLPEAAQEEIGRQLLEHLEKLRSLRADIEEGIRSLEQEGGEELDVGQFLDEMHARSAE